MIALCAWLVQDMESFSIPREDLVLSTRPFASGGMGQIFKGTYNRCAVAAKAIFSQVRGYLAFSCADILVRFCLRVS